MPDTWVTDGVVYTTDAKDATGGIVTAQREGAKTIYSRVVSRAVNRDETEKLFETDMMK